MCFQKLKEKNLNLSLSYATHVFEIETKYFLKLVVFLSKKVKDEVKALRKLHHLLKKVNVLYLASEFYSTP